MANTSLTLLDNWRLSGDRVKFAQLFCNCVAVLSPTASHPILNSTGIAILIVELVTIITAIIIAMIIVIISLIISN